jgi:hypothetical protein
LDLRTLVPLIFEVNQPISTALSLILEGGSFITK